jgi:ribose transport system substrate-binding protein
VPASVQANIEAGIAGTYTLPEVKQGRPAPGKKVTAVVFGNQSQAGPWFSDAILEAGNAAGWTVNVVDGEFSTDQYLSAVRQAVAQKVDGIVLFVIDCAAIKAGAEEAKAANIPIVYAEGYDCDSDGSSTATGYPLGLYNGLTEQGIEFNAYVAATGQLQGAAMIGALDGQVDALAINYPETAATVAITEGFLAEMENCSACKATQFDTVYADWGNPLQTKVAAELLKQPSINGIMGSYDDPVLNGISAAALASGRKIYVTGEGAYPPMIDLIREGKADMTVGYDVAMEAWGSIERLNRIFSGDTAPFNIGLGVQIIDAQNNLPPQGQLYRAPVDYVNAYKAAWGAS